MSLLLALETSSSVCSVALFKDKDLVAATELQIEKSHATFITVMIEQLLHNCQAELKEVSAVAVSGGPGSYTGLRIGSATAKGLCFALDVPLIEVPTLQALAYDAIMNTPAPETFLFCPMVDARRMEVYTALYDHHLQEVQPVAPAVLTEESFDEVLERQRVLFFGSGAQKFSEIKSHPNAFFLKSATPSAKPVGHLAMVKLEQKLFEDVAYYEPFYLKEVYITSSSAKK